MFTRYQNPNKSCYLQSGYLEPEVYHKEPENKGDYSVSKPREDLYLKIRYQNLIGKSKL